MLNSELWYELAIFLAPCLEEEGQAMSIKMRQQLLQEKFLAQRKAASILESF